MVLQKVLLTFGAYVPALHEVQVEASSTAEYFPVSHAMHSAYGPASFPSSSTLLVPARQLVHSEDAVVEATLPASQRKHDWSPSRGVSVKLL